MNNTKTSGESTIPSASRPNRKRTRRLKGRMIHIRNKTVLKFPYKCNYCGKPGYKYVNCPNRMHSNKNSNNTTAKKVTNSENQIDLQSSFAATNYMKWILDSGATNHMVSSNIPLRNAKEIYPPIKISLAKMGVFLYADQVGEIQLVSSVNGEEILITLENVFAVSDIKSNILSVSKLEINGFRVKFEDKQGLIIMNNRKIAIAHRNKMLYELNFRKLVHINLNRKNEGMKYDKIFQKILAKEFLKELKKVRDQIRRSDIDLPNSNNEEPYIQTKPLQLVHGQLKEFIIPNSDLSHKKGYVLTFIDNYSYFRGHYILKSAFSKTDILECFKIYESQAAAHFKTKIDRFRCDNGGEYMLSEIRNYLESKGIQFEVTKKCLPEEIGLAERINKIFIETIKNFLPDFIFWCVNDWTADKQLAVFGVATC